MIIQNATKKKKESIKHGDKSSYYLFLGILVLLLFIIFQPKVSSHLFSNKQEILLNKFISSITKKSQVDPQKYWEFREFYSPGSFEFSKNGLNRSKTDKRFKDIPISLPADAKPVLIYRAPKLISIDYITTSTSAGSLIATSAAMNILFKNDNILLSKLENDTLFLFFYKSLNEMKKANGFFDYNDRDKSMIEDKNWINTTIIYPNN